MLSSLVGVSGNRLTFFYSGFTIGFVHNCFPGKLFLLFLLTAIQPGRLLVLFFYNPMVMMILGMTQTLLELFMFFYPGLVQTHGVAHGT